MTTRVVASSSSGLCVENVPVCCAIVPQCMASCYDYGIVCCDAPTCSVLPELKTSVCQNYQDACPLELRTKATRVVASPSSSGLCVGNMPVCSAMIPQCTVSCFDDGVECCDAPTRPQYGICLNELIKFDFCSDPHWNTILSNSIRKGGQLHNPLPTGFSRT